MDQGRIQEEISSFYINKNRDTVPKPMESIKSSNNGEVCNNKPQHRKKWKGLQQTTSKN